MIQGWSIVDYPPFILYNFGAVVGLIIAAIRNRSDAATLLAGGFVNYHKLALKQTEYIGVALLLTLALGMEPEFRHMRITLLLRSWAAFTWFLSFVISWCREGWPNSFSRASTSKGPWWLSC
jgi:hypothetical protein